MDLLSADVFDENTDTAIIARLVTLQNAYNANPTEENFLRLVMSCPTGLNLTARMTTNYRQLKTIYKQRKNHIGVSSVSFLETSLGANGFFSEECCIFSDLHVDISLIL